MIEENDYMRPVVKPIINNLFYAEIYCGDYHETAIGETREDSIRRAAQRLKHTLDVASIPQNSFELVEVSIIKVFKTPIKSGGLAEHYYLSESPGLENSVGWGPKGLELKGKVQVTKDELDRVNRFITTAKYNIKTNNCEHFANYVYYGLNLSSQQHIWWKELGASLISELQYTNSLNDNITQLMAENLKENLIQAKINQAKRQLDEIYKIV